MTCASIYRISSINNHPPPCETSERHGDSYLHGGRTCDLCDKFCGLLIVVLIVGDCMG